jgi:hypothetical protein
MANGELRLAIFPTAEAPVRVLDRNELRNYLLIQNVGGENITFGFDSSVTDGNGIVLAPGGTAGPAQGGFLLWQDNFIPSNAIYVASAAASSVAVLEG